MLIHARTLLSIILKFSTFFFFKIYGICYALLRDAYVKARYSRSYRITAEQLDWIAARVMLLQTLVREACEMRIETLAKAA